MAITAGWIDGWEHDPAPAGDGGPYSGGPTKIIWHTSESPRGSLAMIVAALKAKQHTDVYHVCIDPKLRRVVQVLPLNVSASALAHPDNVETNHDSAIQLCIIGYAADMPKLSSSDLQWLGAVLATLKHSVPDVNINWVATFYGLDAGFTLATENAPQRFPSWYWDNFNGQCGHQHVPGNDHWDPGKLNVVAITQTATTILSKKPKPPKPPPKVKPMYDFPIPGTVAATLGCPKGGFWLATAEGLFYGLSDGKKSAPYPGSLKDKPFFAGRQVARLELPTASEKQGGYVVAAIATSGERYGVKP